MYSLPWRDEYATGVATIDQDHRELFQLYNDLQSCLLRGESNGMTAARLERLMAFTKEHFAREEALMEASNYPDLETHRLSHQELSKQAGAMMQSFRDGETVFSVDALNLLFDWLTQHTLREDRAYVPFLEAAGKL